MKQSSLSGLDGQNPIAFLAAVGALRIAAEHAEGARLSWSYEGRWRPTLSLPDGSPDLVDILWEDAGRWSDASPELNLFYDDSFDLKPSPLVFREFSGRAFEATKGPGTRRFADFVAAYATETGRDGKENTKPTALHFTAGQQSFLKQVRLIRAGLTRKDLDEALFGPWEYNRDLPNLRWDVLGERLYALRASSPSGDKALGVPGADWLAYQALPFFPVMPQEQGIQTTAAPGKGKEFRFEWALWTAPLTLDVVRSVIAHDWKSASPRERKRRGVGVVLGASIRRNDKGYGNFAAAEPV
ncbi:MAG: hypothetical protein EXR75_16520 [Myxococcales bacterium]|nr:hypothetical protein [Myxococcales bacterium]